MFYMFVFRAISFRALDYNDYSYKYKNKYKFIRKYKK